MNIGMKEIVAYIILTILSIVGIFLFRTSEHGNNGKTTFPRIFWLTFAFVSISLILLIISARYFGYL